MKQHLKFWQDNVSTEKGFFKFVKDCGSYDSSFKVKIRQHIIKNKYNSILDCGAGLCSEYYGFINDGYKIDYYAIEITPALVNLAQKQNINIVEGDISNMPFKDNKFDVSICLDTFNHQKDWLEPLSEIIRVSSKEIIISFFKDFEENDRIQERHFNKQGRCNCIYHFYKIGNWENYLNTKSLKYNFERFENRTLLFIKK